MRSRAYAGTHLINQRRSGPGQHPHGDCGGAERSDRADRADHERSRRAAHVVAQPPPADELGPVGGRGGVCAEGHHHTGGDAVAQAHQGRDRRDPRRGAGQRQQQEPEAEHDHRRDGDVDPTEPVHDRAAGIEEQHVHPGGDAVDHAHRRGVDTRESAQSGTIDCRVDRAAEISITPVPRVSSTRRCSASTDRTEWCGRAARSVLATLLPGHIGQECTDHGRNEADHGGEGVRGGDAPAGHERGAHERADEQADPEGAAESGHAAGPQPDRDRLSQVGQPGQAEDGPGQAESRDGERQQNQVRRQERAEQGHGVDDAGPDQRPLLADPGGEGARRQVTDELAEPDQGDENAASPTPAPSSRADRATSGRIAP